MAGIDRLRAQFNANAFSGRAEAGCRVVAPWTGGIGVTPYAAGQVTSFSLPAYAEQVLAGANTFALSYAAKSVTATRSELGLRADKSYALQGAILTLRGRAAYARFQRGPLGRRNLPDAAGSGLRRERRGGSQRRRLDHRLGRDRLDQRLLARRHL